MAYLDEADPDRRTVRAAVGKVGYDLLIKRLARSIRNEIAEMLK